MKVFIEKEIFDDIFYLEKEKTPNLNKILQHHSEIFMNITKQKLRDEEVEGTVIYEYLMITGGKEIVPLDYYFTNIKEDPKELLMYPRAMFLLDIEKKQALEWQNDFGLIVQSKDSIDDCILEGLYVKDLISSQVVKVGAFKGWEVITNIKMPPINSLVVTDDFLFANEEGRRGINNFLDMIKILLPSSLKADFHILLYSPQPEKLDSKWCNKITGELKTAITNFKKPYDIKLEIVYHDTIHKRIALSNYFTIVMDKGFAVFNSSDLCTVLGDNDIKIERLFNRLNVNQGDSEYIVAENKLKALKHISNGVKEYISNRKGDINHKIQGDCKKDKTLINRLINDV